MIPTARPPLSGFSIIRNAQLMDYPVIESIRSALAICDEFVLGVGQSDDNTKAYIEETLSDPKLKIFDAVWDTNKTQGGLILSEKTNEALDRCQHDWCLYLQGDEVLHERDWVSISSALARADQNASVDGLLFRYLHFYGSYHVIATSRRWYRNEVRVVRRSSGARSVSDAQGFRLADGKKLAVLPSGASVFHYGWVKPPQNMARKSKLLNRWWHGTARDHRFDNFKYERQYGLKLFKGNHPTVMAARIKAQNWDFDPARRWSDWTLKDVNLLASDWLERVTGHRIGEYKPYRLLSLR